MAWDLEAEPKPDVGDLLGALDRYLDAKLAKVTDERHIDRTGGQYYDPDLGRKLEAAVKEVETTLNAVIDQRVEAKLKEHGVVAEKTVDSPYDTF